MPDACGRNKRGFTLIELLIVVAIIGILASVVLTSLDNSRKKARSAQQKSDLGQLSKMVQAYYSTEGVFPPNPNPGAWCTVGVTYAGGTCLQELKNTKLLDAFPPPPPGRSYWYYNATTYALVATMLPSLEHGPGTSGYRCAPCAEGVVSAACPTATDKRYCINIFR